MLSANKLVTRLIKSHEREKVLDFIRVHYYLEEPLTVGFEIKEQDKQDEDFNMSNIEHGTCLMAVEKGEGEEEEEEKIVGAILAGPKGPDEAQHIFEEASRLGPCKFGRILYFLGGLERDANIFERFNIQKALHIHVLGVHKTRRGHNIGCQLVKEILNLAKHLHYEMVSADCTSFYSARLFERMGFQCVNTQYYRDYKDENGVQIFKPEAIHECVKTMVFKL